MTGDSAVNNSASTLLGTSSVGRLQGHQREDRGAGGRWSVFGTRVTAKAASMMVFVVVEMLKCHVTLSRYLTYPPSSS